MFLLTGLQLRLLEVEGASARILLASAVAAIVIVARFAWVYPATYLPRLMSKSRRARDPSPQLQWVFILPLPAYAARSRWPRRWRAVQSRQRRTVSHRDLILFVAFGVIFISLVGESLFLPMVVNPL